MALFIEACKHDELYFVNVKSFIIINLFKHARTGFTLKIKLTNVTTPISVDMSCVPHEVIQDTPDLATLCLWPVFVENNSVISGLCSIARQICKQSDNSDVQKWLGFRNNCLASCAESSIWTRFCEVDIVQTVLQLLNLESQGSLILPEDIVRYEHHLGQPVRIHNIYKVARNTKNLPNDTPREELSVNHDYAEGPYVTLSDLILQPCFKMIFNIIKPHEKLPLISKWLDRMQIIDCIPFQLHVPKIQADLIIPDVKKRSLYKMDNTKQNLEKHTKQYKIDQALQLVDTDIVNQEIPYGFQNVEFDWQNIPAEACALPEKRVDRKKQQLENLVKATICVVGKNQYRIVDFCSGSGHLGILIAVVLPKCEVILVENKERSLANARKTIFKLQLTNVVLVQSNLDYFTGKFNVGLALHACGVATDLVLQMCIKNYADFVICPCCYGGIKDCHAITYPSSFSFGKLFKGNVKHYFSIAHAADQTHDDNAKTEQGYYCMDVIDTDRKLYAEGQGYTVHLGKLHPVTCTYKNNLLVGLLNKR